MFKQGKLKIYPSKRCINFVTRFICYKKFYVDNEKCFLLFYSMLIFLKWVQNATTFDCIDRGNNKISRYCSWMFWEMCFRLGFSLSSRRGNEDVFVNNWRPGGRRFSEYASDTRVGLSINVIAVRSSSNLCQSRANDSVPSMLSCSTRLKSFWAFALKQRARGVFAQKEWPYRIFKINRYCIVLSWKINLPR